MSVTTSIHQISFVQDDELITHLLEVLKREQASLVIADADAIEALMEEKSTLLQHINATVKNRYQALAATGFEANENGMVAWIKQQAKSEIQAQWAIFQKTLHQAKEINRLNGVLISKHFNRNQQLLNHLQGNSSKNDVYGKNGQTKSQSPSRPFLTV